MSFESTDERIEKLENQVAELVKIGIASQGLFRNHQLLKRDIFNMIVILKNDQISLLRFLVGSSLIKDDNVKRQFLSQVSRLESDCENMEAMVADLGKAIPNPEPEAPPPDDPSSSGPA